MVNARDFVGLAGLALTTAGAAWIYPPAGFLTPGVALLVLAVLWRRAR